MPNQVLALLFALVSLLPTHPLTDQAEVRLAEKLIPQKNIQPISESTEELKLPSVPDKITSPESISLGSRSALFADVASGKIIYEKNPDQKLPMASTTKLMTALLATEYLRPEQVVTIPSYTLRPLDAVMGIPVGTKIKTDELMHGLLMESGSDAAQAIAKIVAGSEAKFVALMNERAKLLGLNDTQFTNSIGHDDPTHYSTARDLVKLARIALESPDIAKIVGKPNYVATSVDGQKFYLVNTNKLIDGKVYKGVKTGTTFAAGECLITLYESDNKKIIGVVLTSPDRFSETRNLINWANRNFVWPAN